MAIPEVWPEPLIWPPLYWMPIAKSPGAAVSVGAKGGMAVERA